MTQATTEAGALIGRPGSTDFEEMLELWERSVRATHFFLREEDIVRFRALIPRYLELLDLYCTRDATGAISGFLGTAGGKIEMLFIRPDQRGRGIGSALLRFAVHGLGLRQVDVNEQNGQAKTFYLHAGFRIAGRSERDGMGKPYPLLHMEWEGHP
ncbi:GNAT family N-acetyltransferase [Flaviaesturariibacter flavus]|uniref:GNAT family N-acetyltransferase n=2 Tax=Flaviaesturariibacter flavus TaxID=2502780 RepID=A0A4R1B3L2_9BACT|nr:GNAT family N-acetyltransferase [Flaviaesturariibacter flavus]